MPAALPHVATLAGWGLTTLLAAQNTIDSTVVIASSQLDYLKPVTTDFHAVAQIATGDSV